MPPRHKDGKRLHGVDPAKRHLFTLDLGKDGMACSKCGFPKPRADQDEVECGGIPLVNEHQLKAAREDSLPNYLLSIAWLRQLKEDKIAVDQGFVQASKAGFLAPLSKFGEFRMREQATITARDAKEIYQAISADNPAYSHHIACCLVAVKLCNEGKLDPMNQAVLMAVGIIKEAQEPGAPQEFSMMRCQQMAATMIKAARGLGYFAKGASNLRPA